MLYFILYKINNEALGKIWGPKARGNGISQMVLVGKESTCQFRRLKRCRFDPRVRKIPWRRKWQPTQYSYLENLMHRGAWWVAKSQT